MFVLSDGELYQQPTDLSGVGLAPAAVAQQLTHIELQHLSFIGRPQAHHHKDHWIPMLRIRIRIRRIHIFWASRIWIH